MRRFSLLFLTILLCFIPSPETAAIDFFVDDFEAYVDDVELVDFGGWEIFEEDNPTESSAWTIQNPDGRAFPPDENGRPTNATGSQNFLISDSDWAARPAVGGNGEAPTARGSHDIWTPAFETLGSDTVWFHADCSIQLNENRVAAFILEVSLDDGDTWTRAFERISPSRRTEPLPARGNANGFYGRLHVDLSEFAADQEEVRLRFRHLEPNYDWWVALDNLVIDDQPHQGGSFSLTTPEDFSNGIPEGWQLRSLVQPPNVGDKTWTTDEPCGGTFFGGGVTPRGVNTLDPPFAIMDADCNPDPAMDEYLVMPPVDCSEADRVWIEFRSECLVYRDGTQEVLLSLDGGETFEATPVFSYNTGALRTFNGQEPYYAERKIEVLEAAGESEVSFAFHFVDPAGDGWYWAIDDVAVTADGNFDPTSCANRRFRAGSFDRESSSISLSWVSVPGDEGYRVLANGEDISGELPTGTESFAHENPPAGEEIVYRLEALSGGEVRSSCETPAVPSFICPSEVVCCPDQTAGSVRVTWTPGANVSGYEVFRDGDLVETLPANQPGFRDSGLEPGRYLYSVTATGAGPEACVASCGAVLTGIEIGGGTCSGVVVTYELDGDLSPTGVGEELEPGISNPLIEGDAPEFFFDQDSIDGIETEVLSLARGTFFRLRPGFGPNGGGSRTNEYTLVLDVKHPAGAIDLSGWQCFLNDDVTNSNDGDWFVRARDRAIGFTNYGGRLEDAEWYRVALVVNLRSRYIASYIDGEEVSRLEGLSVDGRWSLASIGSEFEGLLVFGDDNGENSDVLVGGIQIRDVALDPGQVAALGRASAAGIPTAVDFNCPADLACCLDQASASTLLEWSPGERLPGELRVERNGEVLTRLPGDARQFLDDTLAAPGRYLYEIHLEAEGAASCANFPLRCDVELASGEAALFDDFDCYASDADVSAAGWEFVDVNQPREPSTWTITNPGQRANPPVADGSPSSGGFLISDSDFGGRTQVNPIGTGISHDLWSPTFDCSALPAVWLHLDISAVLQNNDHAVLELDITTDDARNWTTVYRRVSPGRVIAPVAEAYIPEDFPGGPQEGNVDDLFGRVHIELAGAEGESRVRFRLRHFEPSYDWWIAIDNVLVDGSAPPRGSTVVLSEAFDGGIPPSWAVENLGLADTTWMGEDFCGTSILSNEDTSLPDQADGKQLHYLGEFYAIAGPGELCGIQDGMDEQLLSPAVDCSSLETVYLHVKSAFLSTNAVAEILLSVDGGESFEHRVFSYSAGGLLRRHPRDGEVSYNEYVFQVPHAAGESEVSFAFRYANPQSELGWWAIADVEVTGDGPQVGTQLVRGDADESGAINITDGIFVLNFLFLGGEAPACGDAADADDSGQINITDGIYLLNFLFLGGGVPPEPYPNCGLDPSDEDGLACPGFAGC